ncbi:MAG: protein translocase subunit SecF [Myxococcales bacterium]|nr:protein translocase subunit SecF [Myxococcales bacterium]HIK85425.1 protein translocase subunit SecF [Myxococcales bacterium]
MVPFEIVPSGTNIDFLGRRRICLAISIVLIGLGLGAVVVRGGVPLGIDFVGGTEIQLLFDDGVTTSESVIRDVVRGAGFSDGTVVRFGEEGVNEYLIRFKADPIVAEEEGAEKPVDGLASNTRIIQLEDVIRGSIGGFTEQRVEFVGPRVGAELRSDGLSALLMSALAILAYVAFRFNARFAPGAVVAVVHDLLITSGLLVIIGVEFDLRILAAMLAILGYSLNDTIIIYDRIRENMELRTTADLEEVLNTSVNQTLSRTVLTSITTIVALLSLYFLGGEVIRPFAFAMLLGVLVGTYSSIFIASPLLLFLETRYGDAGGKGRKNGAAGTKSGSHQATRV